MKRSRLALILSLVAVSLMVSPPRAVAHAPLTPGDNESLEEATVISDPSKSWAIYAELHQGGEAQYYRFDMGKGERIYVSLLKSTSQEDRGFLPGFVLMGPDVTSGGAIPEYVEVPKGYGALLVNGSEASQATYEPFSPSVFYSVAALDISAPGSGTFYVAVFEPARGGHYGLALGYVEEFTLQEWILTPISLISVYQWQGQGLFTIFAPMLATFAIGLVVVIWRRSRLAFRRSFFSWAGILAGLFFIGTGVMKLFQMAFALTYVPIVSEMAVTVILALIPIVLGVVAIRLITRTEGDRIRTRIYLAVIGIVALFAWAGLIIGPVIAIAGSFLPSDFQGKRQP